LIFFALLNYKITTIIREGKMKRPISVILLLFVFIYGINAQETDTSAVKHWKFGTVFNAALSQTSLSNWAGGGENSLALSGLSNSTANYQKDKIRWENSFEFAYGIIKQGNASAEKSDDKIEIASKLGREIKTHLNLTADVEFRSQFSPGYEKFTDPVTNAEKEILVSEFLAPGYVTSTVGLEYKPREEFFMLVSPLTGKTTIVLDNDLSDAGAFGVDPGKNVRNELGSFLKSMLKVELMENTTFQTKLNLFSAYENADKVDVSWETLLLMKVNKYITTNFSTHLIYDEDVTTEIQFKEVLSVGVTFEIK
jgi:hypothetical protein